MFHQLVFAYGKQLDLALLRSLKRGRVSPKHFGMEAFDLNQFLVDGHSHRLHQELLKHVISGREATSGLKTTSSGYDKANVGGLQLGVTFVVTPRNSIFLACPQVPPGWSGL